MSSGTFQCIRVGPLSRDIDTVVEIHLLIFARSNVNVEGFVGKGYFTFDKDTDMVMTARLLHLLHIFVEKLSVPSVETKDFIEMIDNDSAGNVLLALSSASTWFQRDLFLEWKRIQFRLHIVPFVWSPPCLVRRTMVRGIFQSVNLGVVGGELVLVLVIL